MSSCQEEIEFPRNPKRHEKGGNSENSSTETIQSQQKLADTPQAFLEQAIRDGQTRLVVDLIRQPEVSLNYREVTNDLQTPLMRMCHAKLDELPPPNSDVNSRNDDAVSAEHNVSSPAAGLTLASEVTIMNILQEVDRCRLTDDGQCERINLEIQDALKRTVAMHACVSQNVAMLSWALARGCSIMAADREGRNVLHYAACSGSDDILDLVVNHVEGLNALQTLDFQGYSPVDLARQRRHTGAVKKLVAALRSRDTEGSSPPVPAAALTRKEDLVVRPPFPHHQSLMQPRHSQQSHENSIGHTPSTGTASSQPERTELTLQHGSQDVSQNQYPQPVTKKRIYNNKTLSPNRALNPINRSAQLNTSLGRSQQHSLSGGENQLVSNKKNIEALLTHEKEKDRNGNPVAVQRLSVSTDLYKIPLARIPAQAEKTPRVESATGMEKISQEPLRQSSNLQRGEVSPNRTTITANNRHDNEYRLDNSTTRSSNHGLRKLKKPEPINDNFLSPLCSPRQHQKSLEKRVRDNKCNILPATTTTSQNDFFTTKQVSKNKVDLLTKRHQPFHDEHDETDTETRDDSCDSCIFEEEFVLDTSRDSKGNEHQKSAATEHRPDLRRRRDSLSLPDLRDMTGQLVTSREVSPIFTLAASPRPHNDMAWAMGSPGTFRNQGSPELCIDRDNDVSHHRRHDKDEELSQQLPNSSKSNHGNSRHIRNTVIKKKTHDEINQNDTGSSLPDINSGVLEKQ